MYGDVMAADLYDVFVVGPIDPNPAAEARLIANLATRLNLPAAQVAAGITERNFQVGRATNREAAEALVHEMQQVGALTAVRRATTTFAPVQTAIPTPLHGFAVAPAAASGRTLFGVGPAPDGSAASAPTPGAGAGTAQGRASLSLAPLGAPPASGNVGLRPLTLTGHGAPAVAAAAAASGDPFAPPPEMDLGGDLAPAPAPAAAGHNRHPTPIDSPVTGASPFGAPMGEDAPLELDLPTDRKAKRPPPDPSHSLPGTSALNISRLNVTKSASGLDTDDDQENSAYIERCGIHGLLFDKRKSSGCRKCLTSARSAAKDRPGSKLRESPTRRAFMGLFLALAIGFLPAVFYALGPGAEDVESLRGEQQVLSRSVGTTANLERFDTLDAMVSSAHLANARNTLLVWAGVGGLVMLLWYRST